MTPPLSRPATQDALFLWVMHQFAERFDRRAILKGGLALRLLDSHRSTTDIDYVFAPLTSKKQARTMIEQALADLVDAEIDVRTHSKMVRALVRVDNVQIQVEVNVARECPTIAVATGAFALASGQPSRVITVVEPGFALADKLAAWNERRLARDLYDCFFLRSLLGVDIDRAQLDHRLSKIESRLPELRTRKSMSRTEFVEELRSWIEQVRDEDLLDELRPLLLPSELPGLPLKIRAAVGRLAGDLED